MLKQPLAIYIHWPFCKSKCPYCDFNSHVAKEALTQQQWLDAYLNNIHSFASVIRQHHITSIFFGGGTPSLMPAETVHSIITAIDKLSPLKNCEITLETNPTSFEKDKFLAFHSAGVNRISIGVQSFKEDHLRFLGRQHSAYEAIKTIEAADQIFSNYSIDLMYVLPNHTAESWTEELVSALGYAKHHISLYQLTIEKGTEFFKLHQNKSFSLPNEDVATTLYTLTNEILNDHGFEDYEVSNYARLNKESRHNLSYWQYRQYLGLGPGAHSRIWLSNQMQAITMLHRPDKWLEDIQQNNKQGIQNMQVLTIQDIAKEFLLMGLRLKDGISFNDFKKRFKVDLSAFVSLEKILEFQKYQLVQFNNDRLMLTSRGRLLLNYILEGIVNT